MGKNINISSFEAMATASKSLLAASENYSKIYKQLLQVASTMGQAWEGADNKAFVEQINSLSTKLKAMSDKLALAGEALEQQRANYVATQEALAAAAKKLPN